MLVKIYFHLKYVLNMNQTAFVCLCLYLCPLSPAWFPHMESDELLVLSAIEEAAKLEKERIRSHPFPAFIGETSPEEEVLKQNCIILLLRVVSPKFFFFLSFYALFCFDLFFRCFSSDQFFRVRFSFQVCIMKV